MYINIRNGGGCRPMSRYDAAPDSRESTHIVVVVARNTAKEAKYVWSAP